MAISDDIQRASIETLYLDPMNPRLGRAHTGPNVPQASIMKLMSDWSLEVLATSFLESGFWPQEALLVVDEAYQGEARRIVVEGNRRLAALKYLKAAAEGRGTQKWRDLIGGRRVDPRLFTSVPFLLADGRKDIEAFLGFRHVTGIEQWAPAEKAEYIARLVEEGMSYVDVMRKIGSKTPTVRQNYIAYRLLLQMEEEGDVEVSKVEDRFSILFLSLRSEGTRKYLSIDLLGTPDQVRRPVPADHLKNLTNFARWLFGDANHVALLPESRRIDDFGRILESKKAVEYLERSPRPKFETAFQLAGGDEPEVVRLVEQAADNVASALSRAHRLSKSKKLRAAAKNLGIDVKQLVSLFDGLGKEIDEADS